MEENHDGGGGDPAAAAGWVLVEAAGGLEDQVAAVARTARGPGTCGSGDVRVGGCAPFLPRCLDAAEAGDVGALMMLVGCCRGWRCEHTRLGRGVMLPTFPAYPAHICRERERE